MREHRWLLAAAAVAFGEFAASRASNFAAAWPVAAVAAALVALFGFGAGMRGWRHVCLFLVGAALFFHASVERERALQMSPWLRGRAERRMEERATPHRRAGPEPDDSSAHPTAARPTRAAGPSRC